MKMENIILIDEIHTCDSSRYWLKDSYENRFILCQEPQKFDKDLIRDYIISKCNPYKEELPVITDELIKKVSNGYLEFYKILTGKDIIFGNDKVNLVEVFDHYLDS